ncbi:MAG: hypothetical protein ACJ8ER_03895 [Allosphingosinicella sp.]
MRPLLFLLLIAVSGAAAAQATMPEGTLAAIQRDFPTDHAKLAATLAGRPPEEARRLAYAGIDAFLRGHRDQIAAAPGATLVALEARQGAMLRALQQRDLQVCADVGDRGFFSPEALAAAPPPGLDEYGVALVEAAKEGSAAAASPLTREDLTAWLAAAEKIEPAVPIREMLLDRDLRLASGPEKMCRGAAAMHEAVAVLPPGVRERVAGMLLRSVIGSSVGS